MLPADRVELALLTLIVGWNQPTGPTLRLNQYKSEVVSTVEGVSDQEIVESLLSLYEDGLIDIGQYVGTTFVQYDPRLGSGYFYGEAFRCTPQPKARRRQQELSRGNRHGIFISHISDERPIALRLQRLLNETLSPAIPVFVSSDYKSIESGTEWYRAILDGLRRAQIVIVLLSNESVGSRWINFEAGFGLGQDSRVIPVVWRVLSKADIGLPLGQLQARDLRDEQELVALMTFVATVCHASLNERPLAQFLRDLGSLEIQIPSTGLEVMPLRRENAISLAIRNSGSRPLDMIDAELLVPEQLQDGWAQAFLPVRGMSRFEEDGVRWVGLRLTTIPSAQPYSGIDPLRTPLVEGAGEVLLSAITIPLPRQISAEQESLSIRYRVSARQMTVGPTIMPISEIPRR